MVFIDQYGADEDPARNRLGETRRSNGAGAEAELVLMRDLAQVMTDASICGLGQTAASAVQSAVKKLQLYPAGGSR